MNGQITRRGLAGLLAAAAIGVSPAAAQSVVDLKKKGKLLVGVLVDFPPFGILDASGKPEGYDPDLAKLIAGKLGVTPEIVPVSGPNRVPFLLTGKVDMLIAALGITPERAKQVAFSHPSATVEQVVYARKELKISGYPDLASVRIGVARGSAQDLTLTKSAPAGTTIQRFDDDPSTLQSLLAGQVDAIVMSTLIIKDAAKLGDISRFEIKFPIQRLIHGIAVRLGQDELLAEVDRILAEIKASGELNTLHRKWVGVDFTDVQKPTY